MKKIIVGFYFVLAVGFSILSVGCYAHVNGEGMGVGIETHNPRWHYDHDYNDDWRSHHAWHEDRNNWD